MTTFTDASQVGSAAAPVDQTPNGDPNWAGAAFGVFGRCYGGVNGWFHSLWVEASSALHTSVPGVQSSVTAIGCKATITGPRETARGINPQAFSTDPNPDYEKTVVSGEGNVGALANVGQRMGHSVCPTYGQGVGQQRDPGYSVQAKTGIPPFKDGFVVEAVREMAYKSPGFGVDATGHLTAASLKLGTPQVVSGSFSEPGLHAIVATLVQALDRAGLIDNQTTA